MPGYTTKPLWIFLLSFYPLLLGFYFLLMPLRVPQSWDQIQSLDGFLSLLPHFLLSLCLMLSGLLYLRVKKRNYEVAQTAFLFAVLLAIYCFSPQFALLAIFPIALHLSPMKNIYTHPRRCWWQQAQRFHAPNFHADIQEPFQASLPISNISRSGLLLSIENGMSKSYQPNQKIRFRIGPHIQLNAKVLRVEEEKLALCFEKNQGQSVKELHRYLRNLSMNALLQR